MKSIAQLFGDVKDPRRTSHTDHPLLTIVGIVLLSMFCGADGWDDMYLWACMREAWLKKFFDLPNGVPSADTLRRLMEDLDPQAFRKGFSLWAQELAAHIEGLRVAIDGKTVRGSGARGASVVHIVRAFVVNNHVVLGQLATDEKSNEITAIPELLDTLALKGALVTIDAMGMQREITKKTRERGGDYLISVKDNQPTLRREIEEEMKHLRPHSRTTAAFVETADHRHGRSELRRVWVKSVKETMAAASSWDDAATLVRVESTRTVGDKTSVEDRYYLSSRKLTAVQGASAIRGHWSIESVCHWSLDVTLREDGSRMTTGNAPENLSLLRSLMLAALKRTPNTYPQYGKHKLSMRQKRKLCAWDDNILFAMLSALN